MFFNLLKQRLKLWAYGYDVPANLRWRSAINNEFFYYAKFFKRVHRTIGPNAKLTDDEERAENIGTGTCGQPRSSSFGPASGSAHSSELLTLSAFSKSVPYLFGAARILVETLAIRRDLDGLSLITLDNA